MNSYIQHNFLQYLTFGALSFILTYITVPIDILISNTIGLIDEPHERGIHKEKKPLAGGFSFGLIIVFLTYLSSFFLLSEYHKQITSFCYGGILVLFLGFFDDKYKVSAIKKLIGQIIIISIIYFLGFKIRLLTNPFGKTIELGLLSYPLTMLWFLIVMNAMNLIDGIDGMAAGIAFFVNLTLFIVGIITGNIALSLLSSIMSASYIAFLKYNFYPAQIFMGDTGSLFIGYSIAAISIMSVHQYKAPIAITLIIPIVVLFIPITDTIMAIIRRLFKGKSLFKADKAHYHHKLLEFGFSQRTIALVSYLITILFGIISIGFTLLSQKILLLIFCCLALLFIVFFHILIKRGKNEV